MTSVCTQCAVLIQSREDDRKKIRAELTCSICLALPTGPHSISCGHIFCKSCIQDWFRKSVSCPICKVSANPSDLHPIWLSLNLKNWLQGTHEGFPGDHKHPRPPSEDTTQQYAVRQCVVELRRFMARANESCIYEHKDINTLQLAVAELGAQVLEVVEPNPELEGARPHVRLLPRTAAATTTTASALTPMSVSALRAEKRRRV